MIVEIRGNRGHQKNMGHLINQVQHICAYKVGSGKHRAYMGLQSVLLACAVDDRLVVLWDCACRWDSDSFAFSWDSFSPAGFPCPTSMWGLYPCLIVCGFVVYLHFGCCLLEPAPRERKMELIQRLGIERFVWKEWKKRNLWLGCKKNLSSV